MRDEIGAVLRAAARVGLGDALGLTAHLKWYHQRWGRRPKAFREGNRDEGYEGTCRGLY